MRASVIIPAYNARERLQLNLTALNEQSYDGKDVEVIVIDNGSNDNTMELLNGFQLKYPLKIIRIDENKGIAFARNKGVLASEGDILIFHDSDMIASKPFIEQHLEMHKTPNVVACGLFWRRIFTYYYEKFGYDQLANFEKVRKSTNIYKSFSRVDGYPLITEDQIKNMNLFSYSFDLDFGFINDLKEIIRQYGRDFEGYYLPWRFCITNNLSVEKERVMQVGMFDSAIVRYGYEDYDLGVRLYKSGSKFVMADHIVSLHQEHPPNYNPEDLRINVNFMCNKYNNIYFIDVILVCLSDILKIDMTALNGIARDISNILVFNEYNVLLELFLDLLQVMRKRIFEPDKDDNSKAVFSKFIQKIGTYIDKVSDLQKKHATGYFIRELMQLMKLTFDIDFEKLVKVNQQL